jgi:hypothetical protein
MPSSNAYSDVVTDWQGLLDAAERNPEVQPSIEAERQSLAQVLAEVQSLKARQKEVTAQRQEVTQQLKAAVVRGKEVAIRVRSVVRGKIGPRSERLVHFGVPPLRRRPRKTKPTDGEAPGTDPDAESKPGAPAQPSVKPVP